ncbi:putative ATP-dependent RNA helicase DDX11-like protein 8 [Trichinella nelsoni]|uniref:DNA 5'-3' helicase n=1 Tax=Trichinella nelsoni TaxID=6336 RepID=A0A0V0SCX1_9BILA|nr:putative ATP-dependent RNA helicase DDX11-like protein 8 [Trichinella nelsoni]
MEFSDFDDDFESLLYANPEVLVECDIAAEVDLAKRSSNSLVEFISSLDFGLKFKPYSVQLSFMRKLFETLELNKIGIFESPTGTGKSLSLLCGSLTWLKRRRNNYIEELERTVEEKTKIIKETALENWLEEFDLKAEAQKSLDEAKTEVDQIRRVQERLFEVKSNVQDFNKKFILGKRKSLDTATLSDDDNNELHDNDSELLIDYESEDDLDATSEKTVDIDERSDDERECILKPKIYYCSRTHSQLAQIAQELCKSVHEESTTMVTLGSRQTLCINESVRKLKSVGLMNEKCLDLQKESSKVKKSDHGCSKKKKSKCPFLRRDDVLHLGTAVRACPYYACRKSVAAADIILMPYQMFFNKATRNTCGLSLSECVVIVDEAHNLLETIESMYRFEICFQKLNLAKQQLQQYIQRYQTKNLLHLRHFETVLKFSANFLEKAVGKGESYSISEFACLIGIDSINCFKLHEFIEKSHLCEKLRGFTSRAGKYVSDQMEDFSVGLFHLIMSYISCFTNKIGDGRFLIEKTPSSSRIIFILLNPAAFLEDVFKEARSVVLAGGTMEPISELNSRLFDILSIPKQRIVQFSCNHVVSNKNILPIILHTGPGGNVLKFDFSSRTSAAIFQELGNCLVQLSKIIPGGIVCFLPSYNYEETVFQYLKKSGLLQELAVKKEIFREPKTASDVNSVLSKYADVVMKFGTNNNSEKNGAFLFAVVGGKMSEGINFSDALARCVIMVGLPYPDITSSEMKIKMKYLDEHVSNKNSAINAGREFYENICFKAVNQSIGRAIRHKDDYSAIIFLDSRYRNRKLWSKFSSWIRHLIIEADSFSTASNSLKKFYSQFENTDDTSSTSCDEPRQWFIENVQETFFTVLQYRFKRITVLLRKLFVKQNFYDKPATVALLAQILFVQRMNLCKPPNTTNDLDHFPSIHQIKEYQCY